MMNRYDVNIRVPAADAKSDIILVSGVPSNVEAAKEGFLERMKELEAEKEERLKRSFEVRLGKFYINFIHSIPTYSTIPVPTHLLNFLWVDRCPCSQCCGTEIIFSRSGFGSNFSGNF